MFVRTLLSRPAVVAYLVVAAGTLLPVQGHQTGAQEPTPMEVAWDTEDGDAEHLLRGPLHEAFATPVAFDPEPGLVVSAELPEPTPSSTWAAYRCST